VSVSAIEVLQAQRDHAFTRARLAEESRLEAWEQFAHRDEQARRAWDEHRALCDAIETLTKAAFDAMGATASP